MSTESPVVVVGGQDLAGPGREYLVRLAQVLG